MSKKVGAGGRFDIFLDSAHKIPCLHVDLRSYQMAFVRWLLFIPSISLAFSLAVILPLLVWQLSNG